MIMDFSKYIGIPYLDKGRDYNGVDCYGLLYLVYKDIKKIILPHLSAEYATANKAEYESLRNTHSLFDEWTEIEIPNAFDVGLFRIGRIFHVGICINQRPLTMMHILSGSNVTIERVDQIVWKNRIQSWWTYGNPS